MNKIVGKVLVKETGDGVPNVLIVIFDSDLTSAMALPATGTAVIQVTAGNRIGSVFTDARGGFELTFDDAIFSHGDPERRPDLILAAFAPEDAQGPGQPTPLPPEDRILVFSNVPRQNAGRTEAYVLRVPANVLERHAISFRRRQAIRDPAALGRRFLDAHATTDQITRVVRDGMTARRTASFQRRQEIATAAQRFVAPLGAASREIRSKGTFITAKEQLPAAQRMSMESGLTVMSGMQRRPLVYELAPADFAEVGLSIAELAPVFELEHEQICRLIGRRHSGTALERIRDLVDARKQHAEEQRRLDRATEPNQPLVESPEPDGESSEHVSDEGVVRAGVLGQLVDLTPPSATPASSIAELTERLTGVTVPAGPADVTSFHDFHQLQIAFEHVWMEAFDEDLRDRVRALYQGIVDLHDEFGATGLTLQTEVTERSELEQFLREISIDIAAIGNAPIVVQSHLPSIAVDWHLYTPAQWVELTAIAEELDELGVILLNVDPQAPGNAEISGIRQRLGAIVPPPQGGGAGRLTRLLDETARRLTESYAFHYFAPNSVNFGILLTYRQKWEPLAYQVGDMVATIPLAPGETRKFSSKSIIKRTRAQKELEKALLSRSGESTLTQRAEAEITTKASTTTNFRSTAQGSFNIGVASMQASAEFVLNQAQESARVKKDFREAVVKAAQEYKLERTVEVETTNEATAETTTSGELSNPNNEMTVTYLLYELERQYRISERIHRVTPVVLVAQDVPGPHEITESWLLTQEWILRRVLLDDGLRPALDQLKEAFAGDELSVGVKKANWETQKRIVSKLETAVSDLLSQRDTLRGKLISTEESRALAKAAENAEGFLVDLAEALGPFDPGQANVEQIEASVKSVKKELEFLQESLDDSQKRLATAREAFDSATKEYTAALELRVNRHVAIDQLRVHVKENILYYMQAIWDHEPPDQRFFRLYYQSVKLPDAPTQMCTLRRASEEEIALGIPTVTRGGEPYVIEDCGAPVLPEPGQEMEKKLVEIADLDQPLGYKGNYIIFPMKTCLYLTDYMMRQFVDGYFGVRDPDADANVSTDELLTYLESIWRDPQVSLSDEEREALHALALNRISEPRRESDVVVVPTGQMYIEALVGSHPLLEDFKRIHRAYDVGKARAELRRMELDNVRRAARLLAETPDLDDPDIDKRVVVAGAVPNIVVGDE